MANSYIINATFNPNYESSYWVRYFLGLLSGLLLSVLISGSTEFDDAFSKFSLPLLALLGGFSAKLVHDILQRLV